MAEVAGADEWDDRPGTFAATDLDTWIAASRADEAGGMGGFGGGPDKQIGVITIAG